LYSPLSLKVSNALRHLCLQQVPKTVKCQIMMSDHHAPDSLAN